MEMIHELYINFFFAFFSARYSLFSVDEKVFYKTSFYLFNQMLCFSNFFKEHYFMIPSAKESYCCCFRNEENVFKLKFLKLSYYKISLLQMYSTYPYYIKTHLGILSDLILFA